MEISLENLFILFALKQNVQRKKERKTYTTGRKWRGSLENGILGGFWILEG